MRAGRRLAIAALVAGLSLTPLPLHAQEATQNSAAPADPIGPGELRDFNLQGTVTRPAESAATPPSREQSPPPAARTERTTERAPSSPAVQAPLESAAPRRPAEQATAEAGLSRSAPSASEAVAEVAASRSSITVDLPPARTASAPVEFPASDPAAASAIVPESGLSLWPWLLAALVLGAGGAYLLWRRNQGAEAFAGSGSQVSAFVAPTPSAPVPQRAPVPPIPAPQPDPVPPVAALVPPAVTPAPAGIVATRLRPWLDVEFEPDRCVIEDERVIFEFELDVVNSGTLPAADVRVAIQLFNASPTQDQDIAQFFLERGEDANRAPDISPFKKFELKPQLVVPKSKLRVLEAGGRQFFVPLVAINILYRGGKSEGQSAAAFLLGRDTGSEKLAPFRVDLGNRIYRDVGARILPGNIRR